jgi:pimeloyl-[acyl-carrier protein] methyl ester esterase
MEVVGRGPPLVLWHGWGMNLRVFDGLCAALSDEFRLIAVDLPGHGRSGWRDGLTGGAQLELLLRSLPERTALLGWSLGGQMALRAAASAPGRIERLVLISTTPRFVEGEDWPHGLHPAVLYQFARRLRRDHHQTVREFLELQVRGSRGARRVFATLRAALVAHGEARPEALAAGLRWLANQDLRKLAAGVGTQTLVIGGQHDRVTPPQAMAALAALMPHATHLKFRRAGHAPFLSHLAELLPALREFLRGSATTPTVAPTA